MLYIEIAGAKQVVDQLNSLPEKVRQALIRKVGFLALNLERYIVTEKLSGQVLNKRTGALQSSIHSEVDQSGGEIIGAVHAGADVPYAKIHEYGGVIKHPGGTAYFVGKDGAAQFISNKSALADSLPRTKAHDIPMKERSYMRSALADKKDAIVAGLTDAVREGLK